MTNQFLLQPVVRQAQQIVLAHQVLQALVEVQLQGFGPRARVATGWRTRPPASPAPAPKNTAEGTGPSGRVQRPTGQQHSRRPRPGIGGHSAAPAPRGQPGQGKPLVCSGSCGAQSRPRANAISGRTRVSSSVAMGWLGRQFAQQVGGKMQTRAASGSGGRHLAPWWFRVCSGLLRRNLTCAARPGIQQLADELVPQPTGLHGSSRFVLQCRSTARHRWHVRDFCNVTPAAGSPSTPTLTAPFFYSTRQGVTHALLTRPGQGFIHAVAVASMKEASCWRWSGAWRTLTDAWGYARGLGRWLRHDGLPEGFRCGWRKAGLPSSLGLQRRGCIQGGTGLSQQQAQHQHQAQRGKGKRGQHGVSLQLKMKAVGHQARCGSARWDWRIHRFCPCPASIGWSLPSPTTRRRP